MTKVPKINNKTTEVELGIETLYVSILVIYNNEWFGRI